MIYKRTTALIMLLLLLFSFCGCKAGPGSGNNTDSDASLKEIALKNAPDAILYTFSGIEQLGEVTRVAGEKLLISGKTVYRFDLKTPFINGQNLQAVYTFPQTETAIGCNDFYISEQGEITGRLWLSDAKEYRLHLNDDGKTYNSTVMPYDGNYIQNVAELCFQGNISYVSDELFVSENKLYLVSDESATSYLEPGKPTAVLLDTSAIGEGEKIICIYNNHFIRTDRAFYVLPGKTTLREDGSRVILNEYAPAIPVSLLSTHADEILFIGGPNLFLRDGTVIPMTALFAQYTDCFFGSWMTYDYIWENN